MTAPLPDTRGIQRTITVRSCTIVLGVVAACWLALTLAVGAAFDAGAGCGACHAMRPFVEASTRAPHPRRSCADCHATRGPAAWLADGVRLQVMVGGAVSGRRPHGVTSTERACRTCHAAMQQATVRAHGIAVRHSDFAATPCSQCHGGVGHTVAGREYRHPEMDDCLACHKVSLSNLQGCELCHVETPERHIRRGRTAWAVTHGPDWRTTHGMGDLGTCSACHTPDKCMACHGVQVPHPSGWKDAHGRGLDASARQACETCHAPSWCTECHGGVEMPHAPGFLARHHADVKALGYERCTRCHTFEGCEACHLAGRHTAVPGLSPHGVDDDER